jgi:hypothetical protein
MDLRRSAADGVGALIGEPTSFMKSTNIEQPFSKLLVFDLIQLKVDRQVSGTIMKSVTMQTGVPSRIPK